MIKRVMADHPQFKFVGGQQFKWSPANGAIYFSQTDLDSSPSGLWSLLHELGHALLGHKDFTSDIELIKIERAAWDKAIAVAGGYGITIDPDHVEDCIDTYRGWLNQRSTCPACSQTSVQNESQEYTCLNCGSAWQVPRSQACRIVRKTTKKPALI